jgi:hypothetical protein
VTFRLLFRIQQRTIGYEEQDRNYSHAGWDGDDCMLFFWSNTKVARERHRAAEDEISAPIKIWASGVSDAQNV